MTTLERQRLVRTAILQTLADCGPYLLPDPQLADHLALRLTPPPTRAELDLELQWLESNRLVASITPELGGPRKWKITDTGRLILVNP